MRHRTYFSTLQVEIIPESLGGSVFFVVSLQSCFDGCDVSRSVDRWQDIDESQRLCSNNKYELTESNMETTTIRKVVEVTDTPIRATNGRPLIRRVEKILMPNGRYRYPVTYIDMTPGYVRASEVWVEKKRAPGYKMDFKQ